MVDGKLFPKVFFILFSLYFCRENMGPSKLRLGHILGHCLYLDLVLA